MNPKICFSVVALILSVFGGSSIWAYTNRPVPYRSGVTRETCDVRSNEDYHSNQEYYYATGTGVIERTFRHRIGLFNREINGRGENTGEGQCIFGIYFLDPYTITLRDPIRIKGIQHALRNDVMAGTYISGRRENGQPLPVVIDATDVTETAGRCAFMIEGGLASFQQIHDVTIQVSDPARAICDETGADLMEATVPDDPAHADCRARNQNRAKDCDFKDVRVTVPFVVIVDLPFFNDSDGDGVRNDRDLCPDTPEGATVNGNGCPDQDGDGVADADDECDNEDGPDSNNGCPLPVAGTDADGDGVSDGADQCPDTPVETDVAPDGCPDADGDDLNDTRDRCDRDSTGDACDSLELTACFANAADNVCAGAAVGDSVSCSEEDDMDGDGRGNRCDNDIDGDSLANGSDPDPYDVDADNDGVNDNVDPCPLLNGVVLNSLGECAAEPTPPPPPADLDADNDGVNDDVDPCPFHAGVVPNSLGDCAAEPPPPPPPADLDADNDGVNDDVDPCPYHAEVVRNSLNQCAAEPVALVNQDPDSDGLTNTLEASVGTNPNNADTDGDGYLDGADCFPLDAAKWGCGEAIVIADPDQDGVDNPGDNCPFAPNPDQTDSDGDGIGDACDAIATESVDSDGDDLPDELEVSVFHTDPEKFDTDGDGCSDGEEVNGITYQAGRGPLEADVDGDGICDCAANVNDEQGAPVCTTNPETGGGDNCPIVENKDQANADFDATKPETLPGDACQDDLDGDSVKDAEDNCPFMENKDQKDADEDGIGDSCDPDFAQSVGNGCGCRIDGKSPAAAGGMIPFLAMGLPLIFFRIARRRRTT